VRGPIFRHLSPPERLLEGVGADNICSRLFQKLTLSHIQKIWLGRVQRGTLRPPAPPKLPKRAGPNSMIRACPHHASDANIPDAGV
jgi:hypothetical protein